jgi:hypothetical protein
MAENDRIGKHCFFGPHAITLPFGQFSRQNSPRFPSLKTKCREAVKTDDNGKGPAIAEKAGAPAMEGIGDERSNATRLAQIPLQFPRNGANDGRDANLPAVRKTGFALQRNYK